MGLPQGGRPDAVRLTGAGLFRRGVGAQSSAGQLVLAMPLVRAVRELVQGHPPQLERLLHGGGEAWLQRAQPCPKARTGESRPPTHPSHFSVAVGRDDIDQVTVGVGVGAAPGPCCEAPLVDGIGALPRRPPSRYGGWGGRLFPLVLRTTPGKACRRHVWVIGLGEGHPKHAEPWVTLRGARRR